MNISPQAAGEWMIHKLAAAILSAASLGGCSYGYNLIAAARNGQIVIAVDPASSQHPRCLRRVEVSAEDSNETVWLESVSHDDDCANKWPLTYGRRLLGEHQRGSGEVRSKSLLRETIYEVNATTGATGYGSGRFIIYADGGIENLPLPLASSGT